MSTSLSSVVDDLSEICKKKKCAKCRERQKSISQCQFIGTEDNKLSYKCKECYDKSHKSISRLDKKLPSIYKFCNNDLNKFALLLRKRIYPYKYMDSWEKLNETTIPSKGAFYSNLNLEGVTDEDYNHAQKVWDIFEIKNLGEYHDLHVQSNTLLFADVFGNFRNKCIDIYELNLSRSVSAPGLA